MAVTVSRVSIVQARRNVKYIGKPVTVPVFILNLPVWRLWLGFKACKTEASSLAEWCSGKLLPEIRSLLLVCCGLVFRWSQFCTTCRSNILSSLFLIDRALSRCTFYVEEGSMTVFFSVALSSPALQKLHPVKLCASFPGKEQPCWTMLDAFVAGTQHCSALPEWSLLWAGTGSTSSWGYLLVELKDQTWSPGDVYFEKKKIIQTESAFLEAIMAFTLS